MLPSRTLLSVTAALLAVGGVGMLFAPDAVLRTLSGQREAPGWFVQVLGAAWCGFAALNWLSRGIVVGGIYGRPLVAANFVHFLMVSLVLGRAGASGVLTSEMWLVLLVIALFAAAYGLRLYGGPPELKT